MKNLFKSTLAIAFIFCAGHVTSAQSMGKQTVAMLSDSPAGSKIIEFIKMTNSDDEIKDADFEAIISEALIKKHGKGNLKAMLFDDIRENDGKLTLYMVNRVERYKYEAYAKGSIETDAWLKLEFFFEEGEPYKIRGVGVDGVDTVPKGVDKPMKIGQ